MERLRLAVAVVCAVLLAGGPGLRAEPGQRDRGLRLRSEVRSAVVYDDNVFLEEDGESDVAFGLAPSVGAEYVRPRWKVGGDFGVDGRLYTSNSSLSDLFWRAEAYGEIEPVRGLRLRIADHYVPQPLVLGRPEDETANLVQSNTLLAEARYWREIRSQAAIEVGIRAARFTADSFPASIDVDGDGRIDSDSHFESDYWGVSAFAEGQLFVGRSTTVFTRLEARQREYDELTAADYDEISVLLGFRTRVGSRLSVELAGGYGIIDYEEFEQNPRWLGRLALDYDMGRGWRVRLTLLRRLSSDATAIDFGETSARVGVEKRLGARTSIYADAWWAEYDSDGPGRADQRVLAGEVGLRRQLTRRIEATLSYRHWRNEGGLPDDDFTQNRVMLGLVYRY